MTTKRKGSKKALEAQNAPQTNGNEQVALMEPELVPIEQIDEKPIEGVDDKDTALAKLPSDLKLSIGQGKLERDQILSLRQKTPAKFIKTMKGRGGKELSYIPVAIYIRKMNYLFGYGSWSFIVTKSDILEGQAIVQGEITIAEKGIRMAQFGGHPIARSRDTGQAVDVGDAFKAATSDCFKKCCSMLGMFADLYSPDNFAEVQEQNESSEAESLKSIIARANAKSLKEIAKKLKATKKYSDKQKKEILKLIDDRMKMLPDGEPVQ